MLSDFISKLIAVGLKFLYNQFAWAYDYVAASVSFGMWARWVLSIQEYVRGSRILEIGFGTGYLMNSMDHDDKICVGIDLSWHMCKLTIKKTTDSGGSPDLVNGRSQTLPFKNGYFDQVIMTFPSDYIQDGITWDEVNRVLVPGGGLLILLGAKITGQEWYYRPFRWLFWVSNRSIEWDDGSLNPFERKFLKCQPLIHKLPTSELMLIRGEKSTSHR